MRWRDASAMLAGSLDFDATLQLIARLAVPRLADWCFVELLREDGSIDRVAIEAADPAMLEHAREYDRRYPLDPDAPVGSPQVIRSGVPDLQPEIPDAMLEAAAQDAEQLELLRALGFRSSMIVPLRAGGRVVGDLALVSAASGRRYGAADLAGAQELADRCGLYLENARLYRELERAHDELEAILAGVADAVTVQGHDGRLTYVNDAAVRLLGEPLGFADRAGLLAAPPAELAAGFDMLDEDGDPLPLERLPGRLALAGEEPEPVIVQYRVRATGETRWSRVKARPLRAPDGRVTQAINVIEDITDLKQAEATQRLLAEAGRVLAGSLDYEETLRRVSWLAVPALADWCTVDVVGDHGLERVAVAHANPAHAGLAARLQGLMIDPGGTVGPAAVVRTGRSELHRARGRGALPRGRANPTHLEAMLRDRRPLERERPHDGARRAAGRDDAVDRRVGPDPGARASSPCSRTSGGAPRSRWTRRASTASARRSRARCRTRCCRRPCPRSRASRRRPCTARPARATTSAATSTTSSASPTTSGSP